MDNAKPGRKRGHISEETEDEGNGPGLGLGSVMGRWDLSGDQSRKSVLTRKAALDTSEGASGCDERPKPHGNGDCIDGQQASLIPGVQECLRMRTE